MKNHVLAITAAISLAAPLHASEKVDPSQYSELSPDALLPPIIAGLKRMLPDPYSVRDMVLCPPNLIRLKDGHLNSWSVRFALNAKNEKGGYAGITSYIAAFRQGQRVQVFATALPSDANGFNDLINRGLMKQVERCDPVPDEKVQELMKVARPL